MGVNTNGRYGKRCRRCGFKGNERNEDDFMNIEKLHRMGQAQCPQRISSRSSDSNCKCGHDRSEEHTSELQSLMRISYAVFCLKKKKNILTKEHNKITIS